MGRKANELIALSVLINYSRSFGSITSYNGDFEGWQAAAGGYTLCDFTGFEEFAVITDQYSDLGALFTNPSLNIVKNLPETFPLDEWGIDANGYLEVSFAQLMFGIGAHVPGSPKIQLFMGDVMIGQTLYVTGQGTSKFAGATSVVGFDRVRFIPSILGGEVYVDNLYFSAVPAPPVLGMACLSLALHRRSRRRQ